MPEPKAPTGTCRFCGQSFTKRRMSNHLKSCAFSGQAGRSPIWHVVVEGVRREGTEDYWMHLAVDQKATLADVDAFLRRIWLECCGHLSAFWHPGDRRDREVDMENPVRDVFYPGLKLGYTYDFGSSTNLTIRVVAEAEAPPGRRKVRRLAENDPPGFLCHDCQAAPATQICSDCGTVVCYHCAEDHACGEDMLVPLANSPRFGVCGYTGPTDPSYSFD